MKIFGRKTEVLQDLLRENGWDSYQDIPESFESDTWSFENSDSTTRWSLSKSIKFRLLNKFSKMWFRNLIRRFASSVYDLGNGDYGWFVQDHRYKPRAENLIKNSSVLIPFGIYIIEYSISGGVAYSHYSLNYGISYTIYVEADLTRNHKRNIEILVNLFAETEAYLFKTLSRGEPQASSHYLHRVFPIRW
jgi:hypothetical protein